MTIGKIMTIEVILTAVIGWHLWNNGKLDTWEIEKLIFSVFFVFTVVEGIMFKWFR